MLQMIHSRVAGLDLHQRFIMACVRVCDLQTGEVHEELARFETMPADLLALRAWLAGHQVTQVAMESTGVLWQPVYSVLEGHLAQIAVVNARHLKQVPGRKTDVKDCQWLAQLHQMGLLRASYVPPAEQRDVRELCRQRTQLAGERARVTNRVIKVLESAGVKLASVCSDVLGVTGRAILEAMLAGQTDPSALADLARGRLQEKRAQLMAAVAVPLRATQHFLLRDLLDQWDAFSARLERYDAEIAARLEPQAELLQKLCELPGVGLQTAQVLLAELGPDMRHFPSPEQLSSWAGLCPGQTESGGKRGSGRTRKGNRWLRAALTQAGWSATRQRDGYLRAKYYALKARRGGKRAAVAIAHALLVLVWHLLADPEAHYVARDPRLVDQRAAEQTRRSLVRRLERLGHHVVLEPQATPA